MVNSFSRRSQAILGTCHPDLQLLFNVVVRSRDCTIVSGRRGEAEQNALYADGKSKVLYPNSKHNFNPSRAIDVAPYLKGKGVVWDKDQCYVFAGYVLRVAETLAVPVRWGGDWDGDRAVGDQSFDDLVHWELV